MGTGASKRKNKQQSSSRAHTGRNRRLSVTAGQDGTAGSESNYDSTPFDGENGIHGDLGSFRFAALSQAGYEPDHVKKENQDTYFVWADVETAPFFCVCDGHGAAGHHVSNFVRREFPKFLGSKNFGDKIESVEHAKTGLSQAFSGVNSSLSSNKKIDISLSGTTCVGTMIRDRKLITANLGDSRCVIGRQSGSKWQAIALSSDQKPEREDERRRVIKSGARVEPLIDESGEPIGPSRVWLSNVMMPGLAMSRSFGDQVAESVGVHAVPEVTHQDLHENDRFMILASDGVWEFLSNEMAVSIVASCNGDGVQACKKLVKSSYDEWVKEEEVVDDITCIVVYFNESK